MQNNEFKGHRPIIALGSNNTLQKPFFSFFSTLQKLSFSFFSLLLAEIVAEGFEFHLPLN